MNLRKVDSFMSCYELAMEFKRKFPSTIAWRIFQNSKVVDQHVNPDENITYAFVGQKNESPFDIFQTAAIAITNKRIMIGQKRILFGYSLNSVTPDLYNDMQIYQGLIWGKLVIDTVNEQIVISNLSKDALVELETVISSFMMEEKMKYGQEKRLEKN